MTLGVYFNDGGSADIWVIGRCLRVFWRGFSVPQYPYGFHKWGFYGFGLGPIGFMFWGSHDE